MSNLSFKYNVQFHNYKGLVQLPLGLPDVGIGIEIAFFLALHRLYGNS